MSHGSLRKLGQHNHNFLSLRSLYISTSHTHVHMYITGRIHHKRKRGYRAVNVYAEENMNTFPADSDDDDDEGMHYTLL